MIRSELLRRALLIATCLLPTVGTALESDRQQPIYLEADSVELNERSGVSTYSGQVKLTQGTRVLTADKVTVEQTANGDRVVAEGRPATFAQRMENRPEPVEGQARRIEHSSADNRLILTGDAEFTQGGDRFSSNRIEYDTRADVVKAGQASTASRPGDRVRIVIQPRTAPTAPPTDLPGSAPR